MDQIDTKPTDEKKNLGCCGHMKEKPKSKLDGLEEIVMQLDEELKELDFSNLDEICHSVLDLFDSRIRWFQTLDLAVLNFSK